MIRTAIALTLGMGLSMGSAASAQLVPPVLQMDINSMRVQALDAGGAPSAFSGPGHIGALQLNFETLWPTRLVGMAMSPDGGANYATMNYDGASFPLASLVGTIQLAGGSITGGSMTVGLASGDQFTTQITPGGTISLFVGGGYVIQGLTQGGLFSDATFGNVDVAPWFNVQQFGGLSGAFFQFAFSPDAGGSSSADVDLYVRAVPSPGSLALLMTAGLAAARRRRTK